MAQKQVGRVVAGKRDGPIGGTGRRIIQGCGQRRKVDLAVGHLLVRKNSHILVAVAAAELELVTPVHLREILVDAVYPTEIDIQVDVRVEVQAEAGILNARKAQ